MTDIRRNQAEEFAFRINNEKFIAEQIGPVVDTETKRKSQSSFLHIYNKFYLAANHASKQRQSQLSESQRLVQVHILASAEIQFQLLAPNLNQPAILDPLAYSNATFVLYNYARIMHLLQHADVDSKLEIGLIAD